MQEQLTMVAPFSGRVEDVMQDLHPGRWVSIGQQLLMVRQAAAFKVTALVPEKELGALKEGGAGSFYRERGGNPRAVRLRVTGIERSAVTALDSPSFAVQFGGDIPASKGSKGDEMVPDVSVYRVHLEPEEPIPPESLPENRLRGWVHFEGERKTLLGRLLRGLLGVLVRESGF
ncbi:MAG: HlyD family efflux transporter periplasmic adaptor subunit [Gammaproteobacteria bacterium]